MARLLGSSFLWLLPVCAQAQDWEPPPLPRTNTGTVGMIEMPSARMADDGTLSAGASFFKSTQHYNLGFQILPWLEGSFRYSGIAHFDPSYPVYWDRSFGMKLHLWEEGDVLPAVALGINDLVGTGLYSGEYVVASKQFGPFDATLGMGWGRLGSANTFRNPLAQISRSFETRPSLTTPGGTNFDAYFHGETSGVFGGVTWRTPLPGLTAIVEASSDSYPFERTATSFAGPGFYPHTQMNYGLSFQATEGVTLGLNWLYGRSLGASLAFEFNPTKPLYPGTISTPPVAPVIRSGEAQQAALRTMLERRDPRQNARRASLQAKIADKNAFVDALMARDDIADIRVSGTTLALTMNRNATANCQALARTAQYSGTDIRQIQVRQAGGQPQRCTVPRAVEPVFQDISTGSAHLDFAAMPANLFTIDAAAAAAAPVDTAAAIRKFKASAKDQNIKIEAVSFGESIATVYYTNTMYFSEADAIERLTRMLMADAPPTIEKFVLVPVLSGVPQQQYTVLRAPVERAFAQNSEDASVFDSAPLIDAPSMYNPVLDAAEHKSYPSFNWSVFPQMRQQFFDPNNPLGVQLLGAASASVDLAPGLSIWGQAEASIFDTFATNRPNDSLLPHVRTDFLKYFTEGKNGIAALEADYRFRLAPEVFATVKGGYLESMFAGVGGEVLWRPQSQRWAVGADLYDVWQREYDRLFGLLPYHRITGHVTLYYASPWYNLDFQIRAGQYLAGDRGLTVQVTRRFSTGIEVGAFVTKTNVSATQFGEGSFDKGIVIRIPLNWIAPIDTQGQVSMDLRPVQRDGGQALLGDATLYEETRRASESEIARTGRDFADR